MENGDGKVPEVEDSDIVKRDLDRLALGCHLACSGSLIAAKTGFPAIACWIELDGFTNKAF
jgi:hypothetical protein